MGAFLRPVLYSHGDKLMGAFLRPVHGDKLMGAPMLYSHGDKFSLLESFPFANFFLGTTCNSRLCWSQKKLC